MPLTIRFGQDVKFEMQFGKANVANPFQPTVAFHIEASLWFAMQNKWLVPIWNATQEWNKLMSIKWQKTRYKRLPHHFNRQNSCMPWHAKTVFELLPYKQFDI